jgi:hypothetical protein
MKVWHGMGLAIALGIFTGVGTSLLRVCLVPWDPQEIRRTATEPEVCLTVRPKVAVDQADYDFKAMDVGVEGSHDFLFRNVGNAPLELTKGGTSCSCTLSELTQRVIAPGRSANVSVQWKSKGDWGPFRQTATILTNDPGNPRVELTITGRLTPGVQVSPPSFELGRVSSGEPASAEARVYCYLPDRLEIAKYAWLTQSTKGMFEFHYQPLTAAQLADEIDARSGYLLKIVMKPGLPLGPIRQTISLDTNLKARPTIEIALQGSIVSDISIVGRGWNAETGVLTLGTVSSQAGFEQALTIITRGPFRKEVRFRLGKIAPDVLRVNCGPTRPLTGGTVYCTPLIIQVPKGSRPGSHLGNKQSRCGEITIETTHPKARQLHIYVSFAVEG